MRIRPGSGCCTAASWRSGPTGRLDYEDELLARYRRGGRVPARGSEAAAGPAHGALRDGAPEPARGHHRPPVRTQDRPAAGPGPRLGGVLPTRPPRRARCWRSTAPTSGWTSTTGASGLGARRGLPVHHRLRRPLPDRMGQRPVGHGPGPPWLARGSPRRQHPATRRIPGPDVGEAAPSIDVVGGDVRPHVGPDTLPWSRGPSAGPAYVAHFGHLSMGGILGGLPRRGRLTGAWDSVRGPWGGCVSGSGPSEAIDSAFRTRRPSPISPPWLIGRNRSRTPSARHARTPSARQALTHSARNVPYWRPGTPPGPGSAAGTARGTAGRGTIRSRPVLEPGARPRAHLPAVPPDPRSP